MRRRPRTSAAGPVAAGRAAANAAAAALALSLLTACSSSSGTTASGASPAPTGPLTPSCAAPGPAAAEWPEAVPASLPKPPGSLITGTHVLGPATYVVFTTPTSLRSSTLYLVRALRESGYTIARGDAEATEADAPFVGPTVVGALRLTLTSNCVTTWTLAVEPKFASANGAALIPHKAPATAQPLPFG